MVDRGRREKIKRTLLQDVSEEGRDIAAEWETGRLEFNLRDELSEGQYRKWGKQQPACQKNNLRGRIILPTRRVCLKKETLWRKEKKNREQQVTQMKGQASSRGTVPTQHTELFLQSSTISCSTSIMQESNPTVSQPCSVSLSVSVLPSVSWSWITSHLQRNRITSCTSTRPAAVILHATNM